MRKTKRRTMSKIELIARMHQGLRPKLDHQQRVDLGLCHVVNLDTIVRGEAGESMLWDWVGSVLTWSKAAELLQTGVPEMCEQLELAERLVSRYSRTRRVAFDGPDYQLAKVGLDVMDQLAQLVDRPTAVVAANWSEARINEMAAECARLSTNAAPHFVPATGSVDFLKDSGDRRFWAVNKQELEAA